VPRTWQGGCKSTVGPDLLPENWTPPKTVFPSGTVVNAGDEAVTSYFIPTVIASDRREPVAHSDGGDCFGLSDELSPSRACGVDDRVVVFEDGV
jgi:hypothetical protein